MANKYSNLKDLFTAIADAIRAKTDTTDAIIADDFPETIGNITANDTTIEDALVTGGQSLTSYSNDRITRIRSYAFCEEEKGFYLQSADFPACEVVGSHAFEYCLYLKNINLPKATQLGAYCFAGCNDLSSFVGLSVIHVIDSAFLSCVNLAYVEVCGDPELFCTVGSYAFYECRKLKALVMRKPRFDTVSEILLEDINAFGGTPIASGTGYIYVPAALIDQYKAAENWSTYAAQFRALEDYTVDGTITGALDESKI